MGTEDRVVTSSAVGRRSPRGVKGGEVELSPVRSLASAITEADRTLSLRSSRIDVVGRGGAAADRVPGSGRRRRRLLIGLAGIAALVAVVLAPAGAPGRLGMTDAAVLGAVEGLTEFLPVSSTAHLAVVERLLGIAETAEERALLDSYLVVVQGGAILAVAWLYRGRLGAMVCRPGQAGRRVLGAVIVACAPAGVAGLAFRDLVKERLFDPAPIALAWFVGGVAILVVGKRITGRPGLPLESIGWRAAGIVGVAQCVALWPGTSRSLVTILAGVLVGLSLAAAVELSFLVGFLTLLGASGLEALRHGSEMVSTLGWAGPAAGAAVAFITAVAAIRGMVSWLSRRDLAPFGYYRIGAAATTAGLIAAGVL